jgi:PEP-CTERM motif-containing protein
MKKIFAALCMMGGLSSLSADVLVQQPSVWNGNGSNVSVGYTDEESAAGTGLQAFDNFSIAAGGAINQVSWVGLYTNQTLFLNEPPNTTNWDLDFYANNSGVPGALLSDTNLATAGVSSQILGTGSFGGATFTMYEFTANIPEFDAVAGTTYWFSPFSHNPDESAKFIWVQGTAGDGSAYQRRMTLGSVSGNFVLPIDLAFSMSNVPEPSTLLLVSAGFVLAGLLRKRMRRPA